MTESLIRYRQSDGELHEASLPEVYAALIDDKVETFPALRPHQRHSLHAFFVQLGAMAMHQNGLDKTPLEADEWHRIIHALTKDDWPDDEPWQLVVEDITKPAFMQSSAADWTDYARKDKELLRSPDALDMLDTAKNHDLKTAIAMNGHAEDWIFALISMQTMNGQTGRGNYPIARMNSGDGSRSAFSVTPSLRLGAHIRRDIGILLAHSSEIIDELPFNWDGLGLLWTERWNGEKEKLSLGSLHPFFIEVCRRRRLSVDGNMCLYAMKAASEGRLIAAAEIRGVVGDPWTLINLADNKGVKALTLQTDSFNYRNVTSYLMGEGGGWKRPILSRPTQGEGNMNLIMRGMRRKKGGQTEGYYERIVPISSKLRTAMLRDAIGVDSDGLGEIAQDRIRQAGKVQAILWDAVATFIARGKDLYRDLALGERQRVRKQAEIWKRRLDEIVDDRFFEDLQTEYEATNESERRKIRDLWLLNDKDRSGIINHAHALLAYATDSLPCPAIYRYKARESAEGLFQGRLRVGSGFPDLFSERDEEDQE